MNTATVFGPRQDLEDFPFDLLLTARVYGWFTLLSLRSSYQDMLRSDIYPSTIAKLPWTDDLVNTKVALEALREPFFTACSARFDAAAELQRRAGALPLVPLNACFKALAGKGDKLVLSEEFDTGEAFTVAVQASGREAAEEADTWTVALSDEGHSVTLPSAELAESLRLGLALVEGEQMSRSRLLTLPVPQDAAAADALRELLASLDPLAVEAEVERQVDAIDAVVGAALGLTPDEVAFIQAEMRDDPFLSRVRPRYPYFTPAQRGRRVALESGARYGG